MCCMLLFLLSDNSTKITNEVLGTLLYEYAYFEPSLFLRSTIVFKVFIWKKNSLSAGRITIFQVSDGCVNAPQDITSPY